MTIDIMETPKKIERTIPRFENTLDGIFCLSIQTIVKVIKKENITFFVIDLYKKILFIYSSTIKLPFIFI